MLSRLAFAVFFLSCSAVPGAALAEQKLDVCALHVDLSPVTPDTHAAKGGAAPADIDFGLYPMSVLGIANTLRRDGGAIDDGSDRAALTTGPLACVVDSLRAWERAYPEDPWIAKDLLTLELVYLRAHGDDARELAARTEAWLQHDYPLSNYAEPARMALGTQHRFDAEPAHEPEPERAAVAPRPVARPAEAAAFVIGPLALAAAPVPAPVALAAEFPAIKRLLSPWERFGPLASDGR